MLKENRFHFRGGDGKPFVFNHFFFAIDNVDVAVRIHFGNIARIEPAITQDPGGLFRGFPVSLHHMRALDQQLTNFANL